MLNKFLSELMVKSVRNRHKSKSFQKNRMFSFGCLSCMYFHKKKIQYHAHKLKLFKKIINAANAVRINRIHVYILGTRYYNTCIYVNRVKNSTNVWQCVKSKNISFFLYTMNRFKMNKNFDLFSYNEMKHK